ncbi:MAG: phosphatidylglycerol lysyltransferase domain-containing protein [Pseudomonadota bacterium]
MNLTPLTLSDARRLLSFFDHQSYELCEYTLPSILAWLDDDYQPLGYILNNDTLVICSEFAVSKEYRHLLLPISPVREFCPRDLQDLALNLEREAFWFVPEHYIRKYGRQEVAAYFNISEHAGHADYIYQTEDLAELKGNRYSKKRNLIHQFERQYLHPGRVELAPITPGTESECIDFIEKWCDAYPCEIESDVELVCEKQAVLCSIQNIELLKLDSILMRIDGEISALAMGTRLTDIMGVLHFEKAHTHIKGLYQYLDRECARRMFKGYPYLNKESDMDVPGLVQAKKSYHPLKIMKSYQLTLR